MFKAPNYTQVPNEFFDEMIPKLKEGELRILLVIMRQTLGWRKERDRLSLSQIAKKTGMRRTSVCRSLNSLIKLGLVEKYKTGENGEEQCWYSLQVEPTRRDKEIPDSEADLIEHSNISYQSPKETPPSLLKRPTKETLTKEKEKYTKDHGPQKLEVKLKRGEPPKPPSAGADALSSFFLKKIKEKKPDFMGKVTKSWITASEKLLSMRSPEKIREVIDWVFEHEFWNGVVLCPSSLLKNFDRFEIQMTQKKSTFKIEENKEIAQCVEEKFSGHRDIEICSDHIGFKFGPNNYRVVNYTDPGFKEQVEHNLRKLGLSL